MHPYLTPLSTYTLFVSPSSSRTSTLIHVQFADESSFLSVDTSFFWDLHLFGPVYTVKYLLPVYAASKLCPSFLFLCCIINVGTEIGQLSCSHTQHNVQEDYCAKMRGYMQQNKGLAHWRQSTHDMHFCNVQMS